MFRVQENAEKQDDFALFLPASDGLLVARSGGDFFDYHLPEPPSDLAKDKTKTNPIITCIEFSKDSQYIAITTETKQLVVFNRDYQIVKNCILPRVSSKVCFSPTNEILVADKTGDVYLYKMSPEQNQPLLLLGHLSVILDMLVTDCGKYIITCDRDEKIRVSQYPNAYNIETYCLGHTEFVISLKLMSSGNVLLSASGDGTVRIWDYLKGRQINIIYLNSLLDQSTKDDFMSQMDVSAVPITSMQLHKETLAVSLYSVNKLFLYKIDSSTLEYHYLTSLNVGMPFCYGLGCRLFILSNKLKIYDLTNAEPELLSYKQLEDKIQDYNEHFKWQDSDISLLYKRKYDNVQEYMERKKLRLESC